MRSSNIKHLPAVDQLRGLAALLVIFYHGLQMIRTQLVGGRPTNQLWPPAGNPFLALVTEGHTAVALFMVLSGFIFTYGAGGQRVLYGPFLKNRFLRTYPLFLFILVLGLSTRRGVTLEAVLASVFGMANLGAAVNVPPFSGMFWAVSIEWQFYVLFPFLHAFFVARGWKYLVGVIALVLTSRLIAVGANAGARDLGYWTIMGRLDQFVLGMLVGVYYNAHGIGRRWRWGFLPVVALVLGAMWGFNHLGGWWADQKLKVLWPTLEGLIWSLFIIAYLAIAPLIPRLLAWPLGAFGTISYSLYLWHYPLLTVLVDRKWAHSFGLSSINAAVLNTALFLVPLTLLSLLSYRIVESPFLAMRVRYLERREAIPQGVR
jgi:peptidoglycan/LPS O-acetylase OafA/YrhL